MAPCGVSTVVEWGLAAGGRAVVERDLPALLFPVDTGQARRVLRVEGGQLLLIALRGRVRCAGRGRTGGGSCGRLERRQERGPLMRRIGLDRRGLAVGALDV